MELSGSDSSADWSGLTLRPMCAADCEAAAQLSTQLGYPSTSEEVRLRFERLSVEAADPITVASLEGAVIGWIHFREHLSLASDPRLEILGLVIDSRVRGQGLGSRLIAQAETWGIARGLDRVTFSSRITRPDAHRLYLRLGYEISKTSHYFSKKLSSSEI